MTPLTMREVAAVMYRQDRPEMAAIVQDVSNKTGVSVKDLCGHSRKRPIARARQLAMWQLRRQGIPLTAIGAILGGRDHTTVIHGIKTINRLMEKQDE